jgi:Domain of unknown function (DUF5615)
VAFPIYTDEDTSPNRVTRALRAAGYDCLTAVDAGRVAHPDASQLEFAATEGRAILTSNRGDFMRLHGQWMRAGREHAGILIVTYARTPPEVLLDKILALQSTRTAELMRNAILFISPEQSATDKARLRHNPPRARLDPQGAS